MSRKRNRVGLCFDKLGTRPIFIHVTRRLCMLLISYALLALARHRRVVALQPHCDGIQPGGVPGTCLKALPSRRYTCIALP
jgi:hypothetical protein